MTLTVLGGTMAPHDPAPPATRVGGPAFGGGRTGDDGAVSP